jgi:hypothetical protein
MYKHLYTHHLSDAQCALEKARAKLLQANLVVENALDLRDQCDVEKINAERFVTVLSPLHAPKCMEFIKVKSYVDCKDSHGKWYRSIVLKMNKKNQLVYIHYLNWSPQWDEWISLDAFRIFPACTFTDGVHTPYFGLYPVDPHLPVIQ